MGHCPKCAAKIIKNKAKTKYCKRCGVLRYHADEPLEKAAAALWEGDYPTSRHAAKACVLAYLMAQDDGLTVAELIKELEG